MKMPKLPCPLGVRCTDGAGGVTWTTVDVVKEEKNWEYFCHQWTTYKAQANLTVASKSHLESCFGDEVTVVLFGRLGQEGWDVLKEQTQLDNVKEVFVKKWNCMINHLKLAHHP